jgi:hypothetical protein
MRVGWERCRLGERDGSNLAEVVACRTVEKLGLPFPPMDSPHSCKLFNSGFMLSVAIGIGVLGLFKRPVKSPYLVS